MRLIDADAYKAILECWLSELRAGENEEENAEGTAIYSCICQLDDTPTVDAVVVMRCKDCKFRSDRLYCRLRETPAIVTNTDFCSYGKKKEKREYGHND